jgi:hypothetical protein
MEQGNIAAVDTILEEKQPGQQELQWPWVHMNSCQQLDRDGIQQFPRCIRDREQRDIPIGKTAGMEEDEVVEELEERLDGYE